jgi:lipoprotein-releasing system permease protein
MSRLPFEAFLALRYLRPRRTFVSVITVISIIGVSLGVAVLIVVIAVMSGFDEEWRQRMLGFNAHINVYDARGSGLGHYEDLMKQIASNPNVVGVSPFIRDKVVVRTEPANGGVSRIDGLLLLGIDAKTQGSVSVLPQSIVRGSFDLSDQGMLIGREVARSMGLDVGDRVAVYSRRTLEKAMPTPGRTNIENVLPEEYKVRGIFDVGFPDYNASIIVTSLEDAREVEQFPEGMVWGLQVKLRDAFSAEAAARQLQAKLGDALDFRTWQQDSPAIFDALAVEKNMMFYLLFFIMIVAAFGIVNCQITFVVQKTREIGILKALGASRAQVLWLFLSQSMVVAVLGVGLGFGLALLALTYRNEFLRFMRDVTHSELLPASIYQVYELPSSIQTGDVALICGTALVACVLAGLFPAWKASRLQPVEALRYE